MSSESLKIARPGDLIWPGTRINPIRWHVGGQPWYPAECSVPDPSQLMCGVCGERLKHILHVSLPPVDDTKHASMHALMYLFVCTKANCGKEPGSWRALRCQWHSPIKPKTTPEKYPSNAKNINAKSKPATTLSTSGWGLRGDTNKQTDTQKPATSGFDFLDLEAALDAMNEKTTATKNINTSTAAVEGDEEKVEEYEVKLIQQKDEPVPLPGFYLNVSESQVIENRIGKQSGGGGGGGGGGGKNSKEHDSFSHIHELLQQYRESTSEGEIERLINYDEDDDEDEKKEGDRRAKQKTANRSGGKQDDIADSVTWDGEGYEEDEVLAVEGRKGVDQTFLKFMKKLQRIPDQCVRQGRGGDGDGTMMMLWPSRKNKPEPGLCSSCGAPRVFEYQLMAPTIAALDESADWLKLEGLEEGAVERPPTSWDWVTVAVFGCRERCFEGSKGMYKEGKVVICEEE